MNDDDILEALGVSADKTSKGKNQRVADDCKCKYCRSKIDPLATVCPFCQRSLLASVKRSHPAIDESRPSVQWNPGVAAVLSFLLPGLGQIYKGQLKSAFLNWIPGIIIGYICFILPGVLIHIWCVYDAYNRDPD
jgi:TM2 domain-containing membrane protein YozV